MAGETPKPGLIERTGKLYNLLTAHFPEHRSKQGVLDIPRLATDMGFAHETLYRCVRGDPAKGLPHGAIRVPVALRIIKFSHERHPEMPLYWDDLAEFVLPHFEEFSDPDR